MALFLAFGRAASADETLGPAPRPLFSSHSVLPVRIEAPLTTIMRDRSESAYFDGAFFYADSSGSEQALDLKLRTRGNFRKKRNICNFAPIRLNFRKKQVKGTEFHGQDKLKLVTHCDNWDRSYEQYVLKEFLSYRMLQALTDQSFGVRLLHVTYVDTDDDTKSRTKYAFVIEDKDHLAERLGYDVAAQPSIRHSELIREHASRVSVFQYMIGNTDFSLIRGAKDDECCHNVAIFTSQSGMYVPIPYDFDLAGLVDTPYATPNPKYRINTVTDRLYLGLCENNTLLSDTIAHFQSREPLLRQLIDEQEGLNKNSRRNAGRYIDEFYEDIGDAELVDRELAKRCSLVEAQQSTGT